MRHYLPAAALAAALFAIPAASQAQIIQDTTQGAQNGAAQGNAAAGPIGGLVGGAIGAGVGAATGAVGTAGAIAGGAVHAATGTVGAILGVDDRPRFHEYVVEQHVPSYTYHRPLRVGAVLPRAGVTYYDVPPDYAAAQRYRYTVVNDRTVLVDPRTHRVVQVID